MGGVSHAEAEVSGIHHAPGQVGHLTGGFLPEAGVPKGVFADSHNRWPLTRSVSILLEGILVYKLLYNSFCQERKWQS